MDQCEYCSMDETIRCLLKMDVRIQSNKEICPCSICLVKSMCNEACEKRREFFNHIAEVPPGFVVAEVKRARIKER
jgi:hypothetical protein